MSQAQAELERHVEGLFETARQEQVALPDPDNKSGPLNNWLDPMWKRPPLNRLVNHKKTLTTFLTRNGVALDNNVAERTLRGPVIGRKLSLGSLSEQGARPTAVMYSVFATLELGGIEPSVAGSPLAGVCPLRRTAPGDPVSRPVRLRYCGRDFTPGELRLLRELAANAELCPTRTALSRVVCEQLGWRKPDGGFKDMSARVALLRMQRDGWLELPAPKRPAPRPRPIQATPASDPPAVEPPSRLAELRPLRLEPLQPRDPRSRLWNEYIERYHYPGHTLLPRAQLRYFAYSAQGWPVALFGFGTDAWKIAPRDHFIGWDAATRERNLAAVVNYARYLLFPWFRVPCLTSHLLSQVTRRLPQPWFDRYRAASPATDLLRGKTSPRYLLSSRQLNPRRPYTRTGQSRHQQTVRPVCQAHSSPHHPSPLAFHPPPLSLPPLFRTVSVRHPRAKRLNSPGSIFMTSSTSSSDKSHVTSNCRFT